MKTFPGILKVSVLTAIAFVAILIIQACSPFPVSTGKFLYALFIREPLHLKGTEGSFADALKKLSPNACYDFHLVRDNGTSPPDFERCPKRLSIKTDRVITTELARSQSEDEFTPIGSNITHQLFTADPRDIALIAAQLKP